MLELYVDLKAQVRGNSDYHPIKELVKPDDPEVKEIARVLHQAPDFVAAAQDFVDSFTTYRREIGDYWATPRETLLSQTVSREVPGVVFPCDCDDKSILLCSILRNYIEANKVFCAFGIWRNGRAGGHMWVVMDSGNQEDRIIEATAASRKPLRGTYELQAIFNDVYAFASRKAISEFSLIPIKGKEVLHA